MLHDGSVVEGSLSDLDAGQDFIWLDCQAGSSKMVKALERRFQLDPEAVEDVLDIELLPKVEHLGDERFVVLHSLDRTGDRLDTNEVDCFVSPQRLITVHADRVPAIETLWKRSKTKSRLRADGEELFAHLAEFIGRRYLSVIADFDQRIDGLAEPALAGESWVLGEVQQLRREEATVRTMLKPQALVLAELRAESMEGMGDQARILLGDADDVHRQVVDSLGTSRQLLAYALETYRGAAAERQANATVLLSVYASIMLPLSLIAGFYGMNTEGLPGASQPWGWVAITVVMLMVATATLGVFARLGLLTIRLPRRRRSEPDPTPA